MTDGSWVAQADKGEGDAELTRNAIGKRHAGNNFYRGFDMILADLVGE